jgi:hypothetical protein
MVFGGKEKKKLQPKGRKLRRKMERREEGWKENHLSSLERPPEKRKKPHKKVEKTLLLEIRRRVSL